MGNTPTFDICLNQCSIIIIKKNLLCNLGVIEGQHFYTDINDLFKGFDIRANKIIPT